MDRRCPGWFWRSQWILYYIIVSARKHEHIHEHTPANNTIYLMKRYFFIEACISTSRGETTLCAPPLKTKGGDPGEVMGARVVVGCLCNLYPSLIQQTACVHLSLRCLFRAFVVLKSKSSSFIHLTATSGTGIMTTSIMNPPKIGCTSCQVSSAMFFWGSKFLSIMWTGVSQGMYLLLFA